MHAGVDVLAVIEASAAAALDSSAQRSGMTVLRCAFGSGDLQALACLNVHSPSEKFCDPDGCP